MRARPFVLFALPALLLPPVPAAAQNYPVAGYVTAVEPSGAFDLEGVHIRVSPSTAWRTRTSESTSQSAPAPTSFYVGETMEAEGVFDRATHSLTAKDIVLNPPSVASVHGLAIIDFIPPAPADQPSTDRIVRADGFFLHITAKTKLNLADPIKSLAGVSTNQWIEYSGVQQLDGAVLVDYAGIGPNIIKPNEQKMHAKAEYDPAAVTESSRQGAASKFFLGTDVRRVPAAHDETMQARVQRVGESLVPAYQRALPDNDPTKLRFRFQVIEKVHRKDADAYQLSNGIIVVPREVVERLQNDDQLAAILADNIAETLEKDAYRLVPAGHRMTAANLAGDAVGFVVPFAGLATSLTTGQIGKHLVALQLEQSGRVSLDLLHDAGYDIRQAPMAYWLLASKKATPIEQIAMPRRAATLYMTLGTTWRPPQPDSAPVSPTAAPSTSPPSSPPASATSTDSPTR